MITLWGHVGRSKKMLFNFCHFAKNADFHFYVSREITNLWKTFSRSLREKGQTKNNFRSTSKKSQIYLFCNFFICYFCSLFQFFPLYCQTIIMGNGIIHVYKHIQRNCPYPSPSNKFSCTITLCIITITVSLCF